MGIDDLQKQIEEDEENDRVELVQSGQLKMTVIEYARAKKLQPQLLYYYVRTHKIEQEDCICGRKVIDIASADVFLSEKDKKDKKRAGGVDV